MALSTAERVALRDQARVALEQAKALLDEISNSYDDAAEKISAIHPKAGYSSTSKQVDKLIKSLSRAKV
ncbi:hypothetical protein QMM96_22045 [Citrobacter freundii]|uniref:hypothetical protein n=1 Tax=Citrobacter freundii TaxID=546 RepID=UPI002B254FF7|nr:hypothetical protein [Citrobacter freundii]MEB2478114.1 hypothetical protein [Citrobacter freundii]